MSAATAMALEKAPRRVEFRKPVNVPLDLIALRSGVPENLPGRCTDLSETGVGAVVAGELSAGQQVAVELRLPNVAVPVRARALVRYQSRLRCGLEFVGLSAEQREMIRYWSYLAPAAAIDSKEKKVSTILPSMVAKSPALALQPAKKRRWLRIGRRKIYALTSWPAGTGESGLVAVAEIVERTGKAFAGCRFEIESSTQRLFRGFLRSKRA